LINNYRDNLKGTKVNSVKDCLPTGIWLQVPVPKRPDAEPLNGSIAFSRVD